MNQTENTQSIAPQNLKEEAGALLQQHFKTRYLEALFETKSAVNGFENATILGVMYRPPVDLPWVTDMMQAAVMPDNCICMDTIRNHAIRHCETMTTHTGPLESSRELRKSMEGLGYIWGYHGLPDEDEESCDYAEVTGYGLAKFLNIDLHKFMAEQRAAIKQSA